MMTGAVRLITVLIVLVGVHVTWVHGTTATRRVNYIRRLVRKAERRLNGIEFRNYVCNDTIYEVREKMNVLSDRIVHLYKGTLLTELDLSRGYQQADKILCKLPTPIEDCFKSYEGTPIEVWDAQFTCIQQMMWRYKPPERQRQVSRDQAIVERNSRAKEISIWKGLRKSKREPTKTNTTAEPVSRKGRSLLMFTPTASSTSFAFTSQVPTTTTPNLRVRKEYRTLTLTERTRFHQAVQALYSDGTMAAFARTHRRASRGAHRGPAFLPWHRVFITLFEDELQRVDPTVALPYWDSTLDDQMEFPTDSIIWSEDYLGNGGGVVVTGPFKMFTSNDGTIERAYGERGRPVNRRNIARVMARCTYEQIHTRPARVESFHNNVHTWVGGEMRVVGTAPFDPVFYMHHAFIDYVWERFRERQKARCHVDPETDYMEAEDPHNIESNMRRLRGYIVKDGLLDYWTEEVFRYEDAPSCANNCGGSPVLECNTTLNYCVPESRFAIPVFTTTTLESTTTGMARKRRAVAAEPDNTTDTVNRTGDRQRPKRQCDQYLDPGCFIEDISALASKKRPIPSSLDVGAIDKAVPRLRGEEFLIDPEETDDHRTIRLAAMRETSNLPMW